MDEVVSYNRTLWMGQHIVWGSQAKTVSNTMELPYQPILLTHGLLWEEEINFYFYATVAKPMNVISTLPIHYITVTLDPLYINF